MWYNKVVMIGPKIYTEVTVPTGSTEDSICMWIFRVLNHNQTFSNALNVLLAFSHTLLGFYKQGFYFLSFLLQLLQLLFSCGGAQIWILREYSVELISSVELVGTLLRVHIDKLIAPRRHNELTVNRTAPGCEQSGILTPSQHWHGFSVYPQVL